MDLETPPSSLIPVKINLKTPSDFFSQNRQFWMNSRNKINYTELAFDLTFTLIPLGLIPIIQDFQKLIEVINIRYIRELILKLTWRVLYHDGIWPDSMTEITLEQFHKILIKAYLKKTQFTSMNRILNYLRQTE